MHHDSPLILLIDNNQHGLKARRTVLEEAGYRVETAASGKAGLAKLEKRAFDLVVTDYRIKDFRASQVVRKIRKTKESVPIVILSGFVEKLGLSKESTGADAVLAKGPTEDRHLLRAIDRLMKKKPKQERASSPPRRKRAGA
jgi:CheY-like chemotaxis protein